MIYGLDLFSGIGGITKALEEWIVPVAYCEKEPYAQSVLLSRMSKGELPRAPIWDDVQTLQKKMLPKIEIIYGGFPCQDISCAGRGRGLEGKRSGLFFEIMRLAKEIKPKFLFLENVPAIRTRGLEIVIEKLSELGYDARWISISAAKVGAPHKRERWFLLAHANRKPIRKKQKSWRESTTKLINNGSKEFMANSNCNGKNKPFQKKTRGIKSGRNTGWPIEPNVDRVADGIPFRMDRIRGLGNAVVPAQAREAFERLLGLK